jgi:hypothetical protein
MVNSEKLIYATQYLTLWMRCCSNQCRYNRVLQFIPILKMNGMRVCVYNKSHLRISCHNLLASELKKKNWKFDTWQ